MLVAERYRCSIEADAVWRRLLALWALKRGKGDAQLEGLNWAERAEAIGQQHSDLGTRARLMYIASERFLALLEADSLDGLGLGPDARKGAILAHYRLSGHGISRRRQQLGLDHERANELLEGTKELLCWNLNDDVLELPDLPF